MSATDYAQLSNLPAMKVGTVVSKAGAPCIFRVVGAENWVERFTGNRTERRAKLAEWKGTP